MKTYLYLLFAGALLIGCGSSEVSSGDGFVTDGVVDGDGVDAMDTIVDYDTIAPDNGYDTIPPDIPEAYEPELCGESDFNISRVIPDVLILLDRSNSMGYSPPTPPLWNTIRNAIITVTAAMADSIWFGLMSFPNSKAPNECAGLSNQCTAPTLDGWNVPIAETTLAFDIETALMSLSTCGGTPIAMSLQSAGQYLLTLTDDHPKYIILATDGAPNCNESLSYPCTCTGDNCVLNNLNCLDDVRTYGVLAELCANGINTYVLGMGGATEWADVMNQMAINGCTDAPYAADDPASIQAALDDIAGAVASCQFDLNCADIPDPDMVNFYFDGEAIPRDTTRTNGWDWIDPCDSTSDESGIVEFFGVPCERIMNSEVETVSATFGCPTIVI